MKRANYDVFLAHAAWSRIDEIETMIANPRDKLHWLAVELAKLNAARLALIRYRKQHRESQKRVSKLPAADCGQTQGVQARDGRGARMSRLRPQ
jgi:hypothetical protein